MIGSYFDILFANLTGIEPEDSRNYRTKAKALEGLKEMSGKDFGYDAVEWLRWGIDNRRAGIFVAYLKRLIEWQEQKRIDPENTDDFSWYYGED